jgi:hypothetical protein
MAQQRMVVADRDDEAKVYRISDFQLSSCGFEAQFSVSAATTGAWPGRSGRKGR